MCLCARSSGTPPTLAGVSSACFWFRVLSFTPLTLAGMLGCVCLYPGCGSWCVYLGAGFGFHPAYPGWVVRVCVLVWALSLYPTKAGMGSRCACFWVGVLAFTLPVLAGLLGSVYL